MSENQEIKASFMGTFFDRSVVMRIVRVAEIASWVVLVVYGAQMLLSAGVLVLQFLRGFMQGMGPTDFLQQILWVLEQPFRGIVYFIGLQAVAKILLMFMDIEDNTRRAARK
jgi:sugar phosphate permease